MRKSMMVILLASMTTFGLFAFMAFLVKNDEVGITEHLPFVKVEVYQTPKASKVNVMVRPILVPPVPPQMPRTTLISEESPVNKGYNYTLGGLELDNIGTELGIMKGSQDSDARPIVQVNPQYPADAARKGIEGWVVLKFDINPIGEVVNIKILDSKPKRVFDKVAKRAIGKWKYRAKVIDGKQVQQDNFTVQLEFNMDDSKFSS